MNKIESQLTHKSRVPKQTKNPISSHLNSLHNLSSSSVYLPTAPMIGSPSIQKLVGPYSQENPFNQLLIKNIHQQSQIMSYIVWRQNIKSSVVNIVSFSCECSEYGYPKVYRYKLEPIKYKVGEDLRDLELPDSLYLIRCCLIGLRDLVAYYGGIGEFQVFVNLKNQGKVWISNNLHEIKPKISFGAKISAILTSVLSKISQLSKLSTKQSLNQLRQQIFNTDCLTFEAALKTIQNFTKSKNIYLGSCLGSNYLINLTQSRAYPLAKKQKKPTSVSVNFRYSSPSSFQPCCYSRMGPQLTSSYCHTNTQMQERTQTKSCLLNSNSTSTLTQNQFWRYHSPSNDSDKSSSTTTMSQVSGSEGVKGSQQINQSGLRSQVLLKNKLKASKNSNQNMKSPLRPTQETFSKNETKQNISPQQQYQKNAQNTKKQRTKAGGPRLTGSQPISISPKKPQISHFQLNHKSQLTPQISGQSPKRHSPHQQSKSTAPTATTATTQSGNEDRNFINLVMCSQNNDSNYHNWNFKVKCLISDSPEDLKESMHCGEDIRKQSPVKLNKLGKMGRVITSIVEGDGEF